LVIENDAVVRFGICDFLRGRDYVVHEATTLHEAQMQLPGFQPDAAILDTELPDGNVAELVDWMKASDIGIPLFLLTRRDADHSTISDGYGGTAYTFTKPVMMSGLEQQLNRSLEGERLRRQSKCGRSPSQLEYLNPFLGTSRVIRQLEQFANRLLTSESPIFIQGETGSGKGVLANWIHRNGTRSGESFHDLNCAGLSPELLESELFGHRRGSFTGALENKLGLFEAANHGTLFLDEIGDIDLHVQSKLLKVLEEQRFRRLGEVQERSVDVRLMSATRCNLEKLVEEGKLREDLYYRINVVRVEIPSLRHREEDIPLLAQYLVERICREGGRKNMGIEATALNALRQHSWPGNIRELRNVLERAVQFSNHPTLTVEDLQFERRVPVFSSPLDIRMADRTLTLKQLEEIYIEMVLQAEAGSVERAARRLGIARSSLYNRLKAAADAPVATA
jgi:DNA-binding NtrC family response regulator